MTPRTEFDRRLAAIRAGMEARNLDLLLIYSTPGSLRFGQRGHVMYVSGYEPYFGDTMLLLPRRASPNPLLEIDSADHFSRLSTWVEHVKPAVSGEDLIGMGLTPSAEFSAILAQALDDRLDGKAVGRDDELVNLERLLARSR